MFIKSKVDSLKKLSTRACLFYDLLHFRGCPFTKFQFSQGAIDGIHFFSAFLIMLHIPGSLEIKIRNYLFFLRLLSENSHSDEWLNRRDEIQIPQEWHRHEWGNCISSQLLSYSWGKIETRTGIQMYLE